MKIFAKTRDLRWHQVIEHNEQGCKLSATQLSFSEIWEGSTPGSGTETVFAPWSALQVPLPEEQLRCIAYGMTYRSHQQETKLKEVLSFEKQGRAQLISDPVQWRPNLDYETEIGLLINRAHPGTFGFIMANDLTDRGIQVLDFDKKNPTRSFTPAKSFPGALRVGPLLGIGKSDDWSSISIDLYLDGKLKQKASARNCLLDPAQVAEDIRSQYVENHVLVLTGTPEGVCFEVPGLVSRLGLFLRTGFSMHRAKKRLLEDTTFLKPGQRLDFRSDQLGRAETHISSSAFGSPNPT